MPGATWARAGKWAPLSRGAFPGAELSSGGASDRRLAARRGTPAAAGGVASRGGRHRPAAPKISHRSEDSAVVECAVCITHARRPPRPSVGPLRARLRTRASPTARLADNARRTAVVRDGASAMRVRHTRRGRQPANSFTPAPPGSWQWAPGSPWCTRCGGTGQEAGKEATGRQVGIG